MTREEKLQKAHQMFDNRNLLIELKWQKEYFKRGYVSNQEVLFNLWIFDECIKSLEQEPCEDAISRQAVLAIAGDSCLDLDSYEDTEEFCYEIKSLPPVTPQPKTGHWIVQPSNEEQGERSFIWWKCSNCGQVIFSETSHDRLEFHAFCGRCGSRNG